VRKSAGLTVIIKIAEDDLGLDLMPLVELMPESTEFKLMSARSTLSENHDHPRLSEMAKVA
jgi:hypothetical protein